MSKNDDPVRIIFDYVSRALVVADLAGLTNVGINLNQTLTALGHPGVLPDNDEAGDDLTARLLFTRPTSERTRQADHPGQKKQRGQNPRLDN